MFVIVPGPSLARRPNGGCAAPKAMNTLPRDEAWIGILRPTQFPAPSGWSLSTWASRATPPGVGIAGDHALFGIPGADGQRGIVLHYKRSSMGWTRIGSLAAFDRHPNLVAYADRLMQQWFPDYATEGH